MPPIRLAAALAFLLCVTGALAQSKSDYTLYENIIKFKAPSDWAVIMEKKDGNPQFIAFQVRDPADKDSSELAQVTINARLQHESSFFQQQVDAATDKAKQSAGFEQVTEGVDPTVLRYYAMNGKSRYEYRETFYLTNHLLLHIRCARPMLAGTTGAWTEAWNKGCAELMQALKPR
jgi:archaellin